MEEQELERRMAPLVRKVSAELAAWRGEHPRATLSEIEDAVDKGLWEMRARLVEEAVAESAKANLGSSPRSVRARCPECGTVLSSRGKRVRKLQTTGGALLQIERSYGACPKCGLELFPPR